MALTAATWSLITVPYVDGVPEYEEINVPPSEHVFPTNHDHARYETESASDHFMKRLVKRVEQFSSPNSPLTTGTFLVTGAIVVFQHLTLLQ